MSLICGSLSWLEDHETRKKSDLEEEFLKLSLESDEDVEEKKKNEPNWFAAATKNLAVTQRRRAIKEELDSIFLHEEKIRKLKERARLIKSSKHIKNDSSLSKADGRKHSVSHKSSHSEKVEYGEEDLISDASSSENSDEENGTSEEKVW